MRLSEENTLDGRLASRMSAARLIDKFSRAFQKVSGVFIRSGVGNYVIHGVGTENSLGTLQKFIAAPAKPIALHATNGR
jgi:hypothetical protein